MSLNQGESSTEGVQQRGIPNLQLQAIMGEMRRMMKAELEPLHERIDRLEGETPKGNRRSNSMRKPRYLQQGGQWGDIEDDDGFEELEEPHINQGMFGRGYENREARMGRPRRDDNLSSIKVKIPSFQGKSDPEAYLEWEKRMEMVFDCHHYSELKKVKLAAIEFTDYAIVWWDQLLKERRRNGGRPMDTWEEMKTTMRKRFVPSHYYRELYNKLQRLTQGSRSVDEYHKEMEMAMIRANVEEDREATMARFLQGLNPEIRDRVEMQHYVELEDMVHMAIKIEQQIRRRNLARRGSNATSSSTWKSAPKRDELPSYKPRTEPSKDAKQVAAPKQGNIELTSTKSHDIKCFKCQGRGHIAHECPNKRVMVITPHGEFISEDEEEDDIPPLEDDMPRLEDAYDGECAIVGESLVAR